MTIGTEFQYSRLSILQDSRKCGTGHMGMLFSYQWREQGREVAQIKIKGEHIGLPRCTCYRQGPGGKAKLERKLGVAWAFSQGRGGMCVVKGVDLVHNA